MIIAVTLLLLIAVLAFVGYPLLQPAVEAGPTAETPGAGQMQQLLSERENALAALKDLEFEHSIGNLSTADYEALRGAQRHKAVALLRELDGVSGEESALSLDERLEAAIARARQVLQETLAGQTASKAGACPACGAAYAAAARRCPGCGHVFGAPVTCPACGRVQPRDEGRCAGCGAALEQGSRDL